MKNADKFVVGGQVYNVLSPATFGDYMETIGSACINPDGYAENKLFLAYDDNVQKLFRATAAIAYSELLIKDTNCEPTTMAEALANALSAGGVSYDNTDSGLTASNVQGAIDEVNGDVETVNSDLSNTTGMIAYINTNDTTASKAYSAGDPFILNGKRCQASTSIALGAALVENSNYYVIESTISEDIIPLYSTLMYGHNLNGYTEITPISGQKFGDIPGIFYKAYGAFIHLIVNLKFTAAPTSVTVGVLPSGYKPLGDPVIAGMCGLSFSGFSKAQIRASSGNIQVTSDDEYVQVNGLFLRGM